METKPSTSDQPLQHFVSSLRHFKIAGLATILLGLVFVIYVLGFKADRIEVLYVGSGLFVIGIFLFLGRFPKEITKSGIKFDEYDEYIAPPPVEISKKNSPRNRNRKGAVFQILLKCFQVPLLLNSTFWRKVWR